MVDFTKVLSEVAGPAGYAVAQIAGAAQGEQNFAADDDDETKPMALKLFEDASCTLKQCFAAEGDEEAVAEVAEAVTEEVADAGMDVAEDGAKDVTKKTNKYSFWDWLVFGLTILAIITSWTLNNNVDVRTKLGFSGANATAGYLISALCIFAIFMFGPWMYFFFLLVPIWQKIVPVFNTPNGTYWMDGVKRSVADAAVPNDNKFLTRYLAMLPTVFESPKTTAPAQFGHFYY